jgi:hypothetical protein
MSKIKNKSTVPQGMLAPSGYVNTFVNPNVQETTRPAGTLLAPSPGYDSVRRGKNRFQGKGPTGGFREMEFAEDVGGSGAILAVVPGDTDSIEASEWLAESEDSLEGSMVISDRGQSQEPGYAKVLHEAYDIIPEMGDRGKDRKRSVAQSLLKNPITSWRGGQHESAAVEVGAWAVVFALLRLFAVDAERAWYRRRPSGPAQAVTSVPAAAAAGSGDAASDAINKIGKAADDAVEKISGATDTAVTKIESAAKTTTGSE